MEIIAVAESDDCGPFVIMDSDLISIMKMGELYLAATRCAYRNTPITCEISQEQAADLIAKGVQCLDIEKQNISSLNEES
jgi:uncharacterized protein (DUF39 family)